MSPLSLSVEEIMLKHFTLHTIYNKIIILMLCESNIGGVDQ